jgi:hypothetical protein
MAFWLLQPKRIQKLRDQGVVKFGKNLKLTFKRLKLLLVKGLSKVKGFQSDLCTCILVSGKPSTAFPIMTEKSNQAVALLKSRLSLQGHNHQGWLSKFSLP